MDVYAGEKYKTKPQRAMKIKKYPKFLLRYNVFFKMKKLQKSTPQFWVKFINILPTSNFNFFT